MIAPTLEKTRGHATRGTALVLLAPGAAHAGELLPAFRDGLNEMLALPLLRVGGMTVTLGGVTGAVLVMVLAWTVSKLLQRALDRVHAGSDSLNRASVYTIGRIAHYVIVAAATLFALTLVGIDTGRMTIVIGALSVGLGFGLQQIFNNFVSGLIILFERSLKVGDFVDLGSGVHGEVQEINIRATRITTNDNTDIIVPNSEFVAGRVVNWTLREVARRLRVPFGVAYGTDKELVKKAALEAAAEVPFTLTIDTRRAPQVWLVGFGDHALKFELVVWLHSDAVKRPSAVLAAYTWAIESALCRYCIEMPYPQRDLHLRSVFGLEGEQALAALAPSSRAPAPAPAPTLSNGERQELARNDAAEDVQARRDDEPPVSE
jgi:small-conductance mechanosensitive channel